MTKDNLENDRFEQYWLQNGKRLLKADSEYTRATGGYKMSSGADWLLFAIPVAVGVVLKDYLPVTNEMLNLLICIVITILCFIVCVWLKTLMIGRPNISAIEAKAKQKAREQWEREQRNMNKRKR